MVLVPLLVGGGTRIKILEAGNCHRPVVTTRLGAYGLDLKEYESVLYFDEINSFSKKLTWLDDKANYQMVANGLADVVKSNYVEANFVGAVEKIVKSILPDLI